MGKKGKKTEIINDFNSIFTLLKNNLITLECNDIVEQFSDITCQEDIMLFSNQIRLCESGLAKRDITILESVSLLKPLVGCFIFKDVESTSEETEETEQESSRNNLFDYIELLYKTSCNTKQYNVYLNTRNKELDVQEKILKKKMRKEMKKMYPCFKRIVDTVDKEAIKELMEMMKTKKFVDVGQQVVMKLLKNGFNLEQAFEDFDLEKFKDLSEAFSSEK